MDSNIFATNPLKVVIWNRKVGWHPTVRVLVQRPSTEVKSELERLRKLFMRGAKIPESSTLRKVYGVNWRHKFALDYDPHSVLPSTRGGLEEASGSPEFDSLNTDELEEIQAQIERARDTENDEIRESELVETIEPGDIDPSERVDESIEPDAELREAVVVSSVERSGPQLEYVYDFAVFPDDKVIEFRTKVHLRMGIPLFRQHIWYRVGRQSYPLQYRFTYAGVSKPVDMGAIIQPQQGQGYIAGIPIEEWLYNNASILKVEAFDNFTLLGQLYHNQGVDTYHIVDLETFVQPHRADLLELDRSSKSQIRMIYYSFIMRFFPMLNMDAWSDYIRERTLGETYPDFEPSAIELQYIAAQDRLVDQLYDLHNHPRELQTVNDSMRSGLTETMLKVNSDYKGKVVNFRILFDLLEASAKVDCIRLYDVWKGQHIVFDKSYWKITNRVTERVQPNTMMIRINISESPHQALHVHLFQNGTYHIGGTWNKDLMYSFWDINHMADLHVTPLIEQINRMAQRVMYHSRYRLPRMNKSTVRFVDIGLSTFWKRTMHPQEFRHLKSILERLVNARMIAIKQLERSTLQYYFKRGMYDFDPRRIEKTGPVDNYYVWMVNTDIRKRWDKLFENTRVFTVVHRFSDVEFSITGIKQDEYDTYMGCIKLIVYLYMQESRGFKIKEEDRRETKLLSNLKEQDPQLFDYHKTFGSDRAYSVACQQKFQPLLLTELQYQKLDKKAKSDIVQYWNFTTSTPAYYRCPNPQFPYLKFITGKHPLGYCLPCCKKTPPPSNPTDRQRVIYDTCLRDHKYTRSHDTESQSRYIMTYGKPIEPGRISQLPDGSLEPLLSNVRADIEEGEPEPERVFEARYYLYGIRQNHERVRGVGYLYSVSNALGVEVAEFIQATIVEMAKRKHLFPLLLNGRIVKYMEHQSGLVDMLQDIFLGTRKLVKHEFEDFQHWNELFVDIAFYYHQVHTVVFEDKWGVIQLRLPEYLTNAEDYRFPEHKHVIVMHNLESGYWNPIYVINRTVYTAKRLIDQKTYRYTSETVQLIVKMVDYKFKEIGISTRLQFDILRAYLLVRKLVLRKILVTRDNLCYGVLLDGLGYVPLHMSTFKYDEGIDISFSIDDMEHHIPNLEKLLRFMHQWNNWVIEVSIDRGSVRDVAPGATQAEKVDPVYPMLQVESWLVYRSRVIGFLCNGLNWYCVPVPEARAKRVANVPLVKLYCDPMDVDRALSAGVQHEDRRTRTITNCLYKQYSYQLLILELTHYFNTQRNNRIRLALGKEIVRYSSGREGLESFFDNITRLLQKTYGEQNELINDDIAKLKAMISDVLNSGGDKRDILSTVNSELFNFDKTLLERIKYKPLPELRQELKRIVMSIVHPMKNPQVDSFSNILQVCEGNESYCRGKKLVLPQSKIDMYVDIIANQIKNPFVEKYIFSPLFINTVIDYFRFIKRAYEIITVEYPRQ